MVRRNLSSLPRLKKLSFMGDMYSNIFRIPGTRNGDAHIRIILHNDPVGVTVSEMEAEQFRYFSFCPI